MTWNPVAYEKLKEEEKKEVYNKAFTWKHDHADHVANLMEREKCLLNNAYPPSGSDLFKPELWKPAHWRWFLTI